MFLLGSIFGLFPQKTAGGEKKDTKAEENGKARNQGQVVVLVLELKLINIFESVDTFAHKS